MQVPYLTHTSFCSETLLFFSADPASVCGVRRTRGTARKLDRDQVPSLHQVSEKEFSARHLSPAEGLLAQADYLLHSNHLPEAIEALHQAAMLDPKTPGLHDELGYYHFPEIGFRQFREGVVHAHC